MAERLNLQQSLHEILGREQGRFGDLFYRLLFERHPELRHYFERLEMHVQATMLVNALHVVVAHAGHRHAATGDYLKVLGHRHSLQHIPRQAFPKFTGTLLDALAQFHGPDWTEGIADAWRDALGAASEIMQAGYATRSVTY
jgi:hemoglobin-like flavoprotein